MASEAQSPASGEPASERNAPHDLVVGENTATPPHESANGESSQPDDHSPVVSVVPCATDTLPDPVSGAPESSDESPPSGAGNVGEEEDGKDNETDATAESAGDEIAKRGVGVKGRVSSVPIVSTSKKNRPPYKYDPSKVTLRFLFANRDGLTVTIECEPSDTIGEIKTSLLSVWPRDVPDCSDIESLRLVCMGRGFLSPDTKTLEECLIPTFKTHPTPVNVSLRPDQRSPDDVKKKGQQDPSSPGNRAASAETNANAVSQGCSCVVL